MKVSLRRQALPRLNRTVISPTDGDVGAEQVIEGMEDGLIGLEAGETATLTIPPEKAYGEPSEENIQEYETDELKDMLGGQLPEEGDFLEAQAGQPGEVIHIDDDTVRVDFNPRLAGRSTLNPTVYGWVAQASFRAELIAVSSAFRKEPLLTSSPDSIPTVRRIAARIFSVDGRSLPGASPRAERIAVSSSLVNVASISRSNRSVRVRIRFRSS
jgi:hypothetical protein